MDKVQIDPETADEIVRASLKDVILTSRNYIKRYENKKNLLEWEKTDYAEFTSSLDHLEKTYYYYGGKII
jgi:hypothetical protein